ncbi:hypothetical protein FSP39_010765 [Pinctada imbricata]|uniref:Arrestin C-terminal-like domain-containing protein n=1 Tax=Pinctada imbricata TaxID=66713 RepID=A0AA88XYY3_PINIB|nr:hypothetical protein FSP39_010765 [Pinctada imbricata]
MGVGKFEVHLDHAQGVVAAGGQLVGCVVLQLDKATKINTIKLRLEGKGKSWWDERHGRSTTRYRAYESYIDYTVLLFSKSDTDESAMVPQGDNTYPFTIQLSPNLPCSFEGRRGHVRYTCKASLDRPWKFNESTKRAFTIIRHFDLNHIPTALMPVFAEQRQSIEGCCCSAGDIEVSMGLNKTGYVPGEPILYDINITNNSDNVIREAHLVLIQNVTYTGYSDSIFSSNKPHYHPKVDNFTLYHGKITCNKGTSFKVNQACFVPSLPPSDLPGCNIIDIKYTVKLIVPCGMSTCKLVKPILVGTIPINIPVVTPPTQSVEPTAPIEPPAYEAPPPSYSESVFGHVDVRDENDDEHTSGNMNWAPAYIYYDWSQQGSQTLGNRSVDTAQLAPPAYNQI